MSINKGKYVSKLSDLPLGEHWVILNATSQSDGYDGSNPILQYNLVFDNEPDWMAAMTEKLESHMRFGGGMHFPPDFAGLHVVRVARPSVKLMLSDRPDKVST